MYTLLLLGLSPVSFPSAAPGQEPTREPLEPATLQFSWPHTDSEELPRGADLINIADQTYARLTLQLPDDCSLFEEHKDFLNNHSLTTVAINTWLAANDYCSYVNLLAEGSESAEFDYVSAIDFSSLSLDQIPYRLRCLGVSSDQWWEFCEAVERRDPEVCVGGGHDSHLSYARFRNLLTPDYEIRLDCQSVRVDAESCRLRDGAFFGSIETIDGVRICRRDDPEALSGVRIYDVRLRDMNGDGYMDAIVSVVETSRPGQGGTVRPAAHDFVLTRRGPDAPLEWRAE